jgi:glycosyltransferase involved in cell wall biosynthesis
MRGGVTDYSEELLPYLAAHAQVEVFTHDDLQPDNAALTRAFAIYPHREFLERDWRKPYDQVIYQIGNSPDHVPDYECLLQRPGMTVWHELNLGGIIGAQTFGRGRKWDYFRALYANEGVSAATSALARFALTRQFPDPFDYDFSRLAAQHSTALIVHNFYMRDVLQQQLRSWGLARPVQRVPHGIPVHPEASLDETQRIRASLNIDSHAFVVGAFGIIHASKGIGVALRAFARLLADQPQAVFLMVGEMQDPAVPALLDELGLRDRVRVTGYVPMSEFNAYIAACEVCVNLRVPRTGGTSGALLRLMSAGRPVIVSNQAQFAELPDAVCFKAEVGPGAEDSVLRWLQQAVARPEHTRQTGRAAREFIMAEHTMEIAARAYANAIHASRAKAS